MKKVELTKGKFALVDDEDFGRVAYDYWGAVKHRNTYYAFNTSRQKSILMMHRLIMGAKDGEIVDHIDRNGLNNQKTNLRFCSCSESSQNRTRCKDGCLSKYKGVTLRKETGKWRTRITVNGLRLTLGYFKTEDEAALVYNIGAIKYHKEFACFNILPQEQQKEFEKFKTIYAQQNNLLGN